MHRLRAFRVQSVDITEDLPNSMLHVKLPAARDHKREMEEKARREESRTSK